ncbi:MFS transporter [Metabacillus idriensis]|uniref:MFS transporter n=1 Tax=Metabacillus idriensis TaxID=324768 RepID=UPI0008A9D2CC|nr:MFS transporter [Metabacillus idriensis]MCM3595332.1 MFS transporter [Metabacillus idriensis]OHR72254.1 hypothetical protein HMPREF3291_22190 [Bacillus sp. HMSC76G11]
MNKINLLSFFFLITAIMVASSIYILIPIYLETAEGIGISFDEAVLGSTFFTFFYAAGLLVFGPLTEMAGKKKILIAGFGCSIIATVLLAFAAPSTFLPLRSLQGFFLGCFAPVAYAYCFEAFDEKIRTRLISLINMGFLMSGIIGQLISSAIEAAFNWAAVFYFFACMYAFVMAGMVFLIEEKKRGTARKNFFSSLSSILKNKKLLLCYLLAFAMLMSFVAYYEGFHREYGRTVSSEALFWAKAAGLTGVFFSLMSVKWIIRYGKLTAVRYAMIGIILSFLLSFLSTNLYMSAGFSVLYTASLSICIPAVISLIGEYGGRDRATAVSLYSFLLLAGASIGPLIAGIFSFHGILFLFSVFYSIAVLFTIRK